MSSCADCIGSCSNDCSHCGSRQIVLCPAEAALLFELGQYAFMPVFYETNTGRFSPIEEAESEFHDVVISLKNKGLIYADADIPLKNVVYPKKNAAHGSLAMTALGQETLETLEIQEIPY
ncbi:MAG: hypothetical protein RR053_03645 [Evtepia sp.]